MDQKIIVISKMKKYSKKLRGSIFTFRGYLKGDHINQIIVMSEDFTQGGVYLIYAENYKVMDTSIIIKDYVRSKLIVR